MMNNTSCDPVALDDLLNEDCDAQTMVELESHLGHCTDCQTKLTNLAAEKSLWTQACSQLSTIEQIVLPNVVADRLQMSGSFVVPEFSKNEEQRNESPDRLSTQQEPNPFYANNQWTQILDPPTHPETLGKIDGFEVESKIGQGGMGIVLKGFDRELNRAVAIKVLAPHFAANGTARQRFAREAEAAAAVMHPNVVPIYAVNKSSERPYIVMQLVSGHSLQSLVQENGPLAPTDVVRISMQIAAGLSAAHKLGLIHRDVKPSNMLVERDVSRVMITDFGLARAADDVGMTQTGWLAGTPNYMSPEQSKGEDVDTRNDLFSLGSLMYFIATGREPFRAETPYAVIQKIVNVEPASPIELNPEIPSTLADIIEKLLEKDPKNRFQTAGEVFAVLEQYLAHLQHPTRTKPPKRVMTSRRKRKRWAIGSVVGAGTLAIAAAGFAWLNFGQAKVEKPTHRLSEINLSESASDTPSSSANRLDVDPGSTPSTSADWLDDSSSVVLAEADKNRTAGDESRKKGIGSEEPLRFPSVSEPVASGGFEFGLETGDDSFTKQLSEFEKELEQFESNFRNESLQPAPILWDRTDRLESGIGEVESQLNSLESNLNNSEFGEPVKPSK